MQKRAHEREATPRARAALHSGCGHSEVTLSAAAASLLAGQPEAAEFSDPIFARAEFMYILSARPAVAVFIMCA